MRGILIYQLFTNAKYINKYKIWNPKFNDVLWAFSSHSCSCVVFRRQFPMLFYWTQTFAILRYYYRFYQQLWRKTVFVFVKFRLHASGNCEQCSVFASTMSLLTNAANKRRNNNSHSTRTNIFWDPEWVHIRCWMRKNMCMKTEGRNLAAKCWNV